MPLLHGSQGCTSFGLVLFVRHFREAIPLQTTAMSEVATVLGGLENVEQADRSISPTGPSRRSSGFVPPASPKPKATTWTASFRLIRARHPELDHVALVYVSTPDFKGAFQDGWAKTVDRMVEAFVEPPAMASCAPGR